MMYRPFHKTLPRSRRFVNWISVRFYETDCTIHKKLTNSNMYIHEIIIIWYGVNRKTGLLVEGGWGVTICMRQLMP